MKVFLSIVGSISEMFVKFRTFCSISKCSLNLEHSGKKEEYPSLIITEIIASEKDVYFSV